jgi:glycerol uptake facilitator protein
MGVPIIGPLIGGVIGVLAHDLFIGDTLYARRSQLLLGDTAQIPPPGPDTQESKTLQRKE